MANMTSKTSTTPSIQNPRTWRYLRYSAIIAILAVLPLLMPSNYYRQIFNQIVIFVILALGYDLVLGRLGQLSFGQIGLFAIGAYASALLTTRLHAPFLVGMLGAAVAGGFAGAMIGIPALRIKGHYLVLLTLAFGEMVVLLLNNLGGLTGGSQGISEIPAPSIGPLHFASRQSLSYLLLAFAVLAVLGIVMIDRSRFGRAFVAVKDAELAADVSGVNLASTKILAFVISAVYAGLAGGLYAHTFRYVSPEFFGLGLTISLLAMVLLGGRGSIVGVVMGVVVLTLLPESLRFVKQYYMLVFGLGIWLLVMFLPGGLVSIIPHFRGALGRYRNRLRALVAARDERA